MKKFFYVDVPNPNSREGKNKESLDWINVGVFPTRKNAQKFLRDVWGIRKDFTEVFISEGQYHNA